jgi:uncharacterized membrane protein
MKTSSNNGCGCRFFRFGMMVAAAACLGLLMALPAAATHYDYTIISRERDVWASYINNNGIVAGMTYGEPALSIGFLYIDENFTFVDMAPLYGINNHGDAAGATRNGKAIIYHDGSYTELPLPEGWTWAQASGINDSGAVVGDGGPDSSSENNRGFLYENGAYTIIKPPGNWKFIRGVLINNNGDIAGMGDEIYDPEWGNYTTKGFLYHNGEYTILLPPSGFSISAIWDISDNGTVVGTGFNYVDPNYPFKSGFLYSGGAYKLIAPPGCTGAEALGINNRGDVVGLVEGTTRGFVYCGGTYQEIIPPGYEGAGAYSINDSGVIVGSCRENAYAGSFSGYIATPKPIHPVPAINLLLD